MSEQWLRERLRGLEMPGEAAARERSWHVVRAALSERSQLGGRARPPGRLVAAVALVAAVVVAGLTPAGADVRRWIKDLVEDPGIERARPGLTSLPAPGELLVSSERGIWVVREDGSKRLLGDYDQASWSPNGLFAIATSGRELTAVDPAGTPRWSLSQRRRVADPRWSSSGFRIAYRSGDELRVVAGDGLSDRRLARNVAAAAPAWQPASPAELEESPGGLGTHLLAYADARGRIALLDVDRNTLLWRTQPGPAPTALSWSADGALLAAVGEGGLRLYQGSGEELLRQRGRDGVRYRAAVFAPQGSRYALVESRMRADGARRSTVQVVEAGGKGPLSEVFSGSGSIGAVAWSPDGRWLLVPWRSADQWLFVPTALEPGSARIEATAEIARAFDPGGGPGSGFPRVDGWCCP